MTLYLIGYMSAGKSTVGRTLAELLGYEFVDTDIYIESRFRQRVADLFRLHGDEYFRQKERMILEEIAGLPDAVIATGGGLPIYHDNMDILLESGTVLYLRYSSEALAQRLELTKRTSPSVSHLTGEELLQHVTEAMRLREPIYSRAHHTIDMETLAKQGINTEAKIASWIAQQLRSAE